MSEWFAQVNGKKVVAVTHATPPHELKDNQIDLTKAEFDFLSKYSIEEAEIMLSNLRTKIEVLK